MSFGVFFVIFPTASLVASPLESLHRSEREKERSWDSVRQYPAVPSVHPLCLTVVDLLCQGALLPVPPFTPLHPPPPPLASCLSIGGQGLWWWAGPAVAVSASSARGTGPGTVILAMYTFMVGPWLPKEQQQSETISAGLIRTPEGRETIEDVKHGTKNRVSNSHGATCGAWTRGEERRCAGGLTDPSDALAPTLSPAAFQHTSKMPPVPR